MSVSEVWKVRWGVGRKGTGYQRVMCEGQWVSMDGVGEIREGRGRVGGVRKSSLNAERIQMKWEVNDHVKDI